MIATAVLGAVAGAVTAWIFIETGPIGNLVLGNSTGLRQQYGWIPLQTLALLVVLAGIAGAVWWRFRDLAGARRLALRTAALAVPSGAVAAAPLIGFAWATSYDTSAYALVLGTALGAVILAGVLRLGLPRQPGRQSGQSAAT